ncbi:E3 ubiquitin-protein ligase RNF26 [Ascaphus truei]|uniref:E3 ubiquitin-protein ligase RNF26 n=1 Tax=Ascaphus truei TaxID=8439 RepID=UPI003F591D5C
MEVLLLLLSGLGWTLEMLLLVLDLNYCLVSSLVSALLWTIGFTLSLPGALVLSILQFRDGLLAYALRLGESCSGLALGALQTIGDTMRGGLAGLDSLKLVGNLLSHILLRSKETVQRVLLHIATSGQGLHRQLWEALGIAGSLAAYLVNSLVNVCLIATQNVFSSALGLWLALADSFLMGSALLESFISHLSSSAFAMVILLWSPCQLALDGLASMSRGLGSIFFRNLYLILILLLLWLCMGLTRPTLASRLLRGRVRRVCRAVWLCAGELLNCEVWRRVAARSLHLIRIYRAAWERDQNRRTRVNQAQDPQHHPARLPIPAPARLPIPVPARLPIPVPARLPIPVPARGPIAVPHLPDRNVAPPRQDGASMPPPRDPWELLKEQEERKKCVICQDETKTVLLLPCRHLCLCGSCTQILLQQPILQRNCPLCRQMILQTLNVYT